ncbi:MAG: nucleotidyltransferase family protein [Bacillota bacterium]|jgi:predicted nucleotidyltransferase
MQLTDITSATRLINILRNHQVTRASVFGSYARGEADENSDLDLLIELPANNSLFDLINLKFKLEDELQKKVDLITFASINKQIKDQILAERMDLF